ncbi:hypothetical protein C8R45DRAFT_932718 [Mycena sanguinolenta]|nr:hypothetical protein C8R45DRAFT_932718 [Mycena sanguinolenta]
MAGATESTRFRSTKYESTVATHRPSRRCSSAVARPQFEGWGANLILPVITTGRATRGGWRVWAFKLRISTSTTRELAVRVGRVAGTRAPTRVKWRVTRTRATGRVQWRRCDNDVLRDGWVSACAGFGGKAGNSSEATVTGGGSTPVSRTCNDRIRCSNLMESPQKRFGVAKSFGGADQKFHGRPCLFRGIDDFPETYTE